MTEAAARCLREDVAETVIHAVGHDETDRDEGDQLDYRFERDRRHHALVVLGGVDVAGAEQDAEGGHQQGDVQSEIAPERRRRRVVENHRDADRHRLQLQRDVRHDADHRDDRDQAAEQRALAIARGGEIGDRGDAVGLGDAQHAAEHEPPQAGHQRRSEIDRQEPDAACGGAADAAVEGPGGAVDRDAERVDIRAVDDAAPLLGAPVAVVRDREQHAQIGARHQQQDPAAQHAVGPQRTVRRSTSSARSRMIQAHAPNR